MKNIRHTLLILLLVTYSMASKATLIDNDLFTTDTKTGLDWLDFSETQDFSFNYISTQLGKEGPWKDWRFAETSEVISLFDNAGGTGLYDGTYDLNGHNGAATLLLDLLGETRPEHDLYRMASVHFKGNTQSPELAGVFIREWKPDNYFDILEVGQYKFASGDSEQGSALALVRTSITTVSEPSALCLFVLALLGVIRPITRK